MRVMKVQNKSAIYSVPQKFFCDFGSMDQKNASTFSVSSVRGYGLPARTRDDIFII